MVVTQKESIAEKRPILCVEIKSKLFKIEVSMYRIKIATNIQIKQHKILNNLYMSKDKNWSC